VSFRGFGRVARRRGLAFLGAAALAGGSVGIAACGSDDEESGGGGGAEGGEITIAQTSQPDYLDPALGYTVNAIEPMWVVYTPPYTYKHVEGDAGREQIPGLAEELPEISEDGLEYSFKFRDGLVYSDGTEFKASDFEHAIKRVLTLESGGSLFFEYIEGADEYLKAGDPEADISGIETDDKTGEVKITLAEPYAAFNFVLGMWFAAPVPGDTPFKNMTEDPAPGIGPYMFTESVPNRQFVMEKNPEFEKLGIPDIPTGNVDKITTLIVKNANQQAQDVLSGELDYMQDPPPADLKPTVLEQADERYEEFATPSTYYIGLNTQVAPTDDPLVRQAINYGLDKPALARLYAGEVQPGCAFTPPGVFGYDEEFDTTGCPYGDPTQPPDLEKAKELIKEAGAEGEKVTVWGNNDDPTDKVTEAVADQLNEIGLDATPKIIDGGIYFATIGNEKTGAAITFNNWFLDWPHPLNLYFLADPDAIQPTNNQNYSNIDDPEVDKQLDALEKETDIEAVQDEWAALDRYIIEPPQSYMAPYGHRKLATFLSERMDFESAVFHPVYFNDYTTFALKEGEE
jgi:peptide/nickel transport system substrate-binding protein